MQNLKELERLADFLLDRDATHLSSEDKYNEFDVMNACLIFNSIVGNYAIKHGFIKTMDESMNFGRVMRNLILQMTGIKTKEYFQNDIQRH